MMNLLVIGINNYYLLEENKCSFNCVFIDKNNLRRKF